MKDDLRIVFMGTPGFSVGIMEAILNAGMNIVGAVTVADKPAGRGQLMHESAVKTFAVEKQIPVLQPVKLKDETFLADLKALEADVFVVVAFRMLPAEVWKMPRFGTFNLHASLLPDYRGAAPINWTLINGDSETGVSTFFIDEAIDTGNVIGQTKMPIGPNELAGELHDRMMIIGGELVVQTLTQIQDGTVTTIPQAEMKESLQRPAPKLFKENTQIDWKQSAQAIHNLVRGLSPYPSAWTRWEKEQEGVKSIKIFETRLSEKATKGDLSLEADKQLIYVHCLDQCLEIHAFQVEGKKRMSAKEWLVGNKIADWKVVL